MALNQSLFSFSLSRVILQSVLLFPLLTALGWMMGRSGRRATLAPVRAGGARRRRGHC